MAQDVIGALVSILAADADVAALAAARVYGDEINPDEIANQPRPAVVLEPSGGAVPTFTQGTSPLEAFRFDAFAYGANPREADRLRRAVYAAFRGITRQTQSGVLIHWVQPAGGFSSDRDPDTGWPRAFNSWQVLADTRSAP